MTEARGGALMCCHVRIDALPADVAIRRLVAEPTGVLVLHLCNAYTLSLARRDRAYAAMLNEADLNLADGTPVAWLGRLVGAWKHAHASRGPDVMRDLLKAGQQTGLRHYFFGSTTEVLTALERNVAQFAPDARIVGVESPRFGDLSDTEYAAAAQRIAATEADVVWVGLGTPRQDWAAAALGRHLPRGTVIPVGAAFDFLAGTVPEAPSWVRRTGLEWLFRLASEPRRLWKRYLVGNLGFLYGVVRDGTRRIHATRP